MRWLRTSLTTFMMIGTDLTTNLSLEFFAIITFLYMPFIFSHAVSVVDYIALVQLVLLTYL